jgi:MFS family permease
MIEERLSSLRLLLVIQLAQTFRGGVVSPILSLFIRGQGVSVAEIGLLGTTGMLGWLVFEPISGFVADKVRKRYMVSFAIVASSLIYASYPSASSIWHFAILAFLLSSVMAPYAIAVKALTAELLPEMGRAKTYGRYLSVISVGGILGPVLGGYLSVVGYDLPFYLAAVVGVVCLTGILLMRYDDKVGDIYRMREATGEGSERLITRPFLIILLIRMLYFFNRAFRDNFLPVFLNETPVIGASETEIGIYMGALRVTAALSQSILGDLTDRLGSKIVMALSLGLAGLSYLSLTSVRGVLPLYLLGAAQGVTLASADLSMMIHLMEIMPVGRTGVVMGLYSESENVGGMIASSSLGLIYDQMGSMYSAFSVSGVLIFNAALSMILIKSQKKA